MDEEKQKFLLKRGVMGVGIPVSILMSITFAFETPGHVLRMQAFDWRRFVLSLVIFVPVFSTAGYVWGLLVYRFLRKK